MGDNHDFGELTATDLKKLRSVVKRKSSRLLTKEDREDIVSKILEDAVSGSLRTGTPVVKLAFTFSNYASYYTRPLDGVMARLREQEPLVYDEHGEIADEADVPDERIDFSGPIVIDLLNQLPSDHRVAFSAVLDGGTVAEVASGIGLPRSTAHNRIKQARSALRDMWLAA